MVNSEWYLVAERCTLHAVFLYNCQGSSTNRPFYAKQTQFSPFFGPKTRFCRDTQMNVSSVLASSYGDMAALTARQNKPKQSQFRYILCSRPSPHLPVDRGFPKAALHVCRAIDGLHRYISGNEERMHLKNPPAIMNRTRMPMQSNNDLTCTGHNRSIKSICTTIYEVRYTGICSQDL